jgi:hypothetical protein
LLQGRLALFQLDLHEAQNYLIQAQIIAMDHDLHRLAQQISDEHDTHLYEFDLWQNLKDAQVSLEQRLEMVSKEDIMRRILEKQAVNPLKLEEEISLLLIIMSTGGTPIFIHPFSDAWGVHEAMFSSFLSAVSSWGKGVFAQSIDRMGFKDYTILLHSVEPFSVCYVIQGQSYPAQQKLTRFLTEIQTQSDIWERLLKSHKTSMLLDTDNTPALGTLVRDIFNTE